MNPYLGINEAKITLRNNGKELSLNTEDFPTATLLSAYHGLGDVIHRRLADVFAREDQRHASGRGVG